MVTAIQRFGLAGATLALLFPGVGSAGIQAMPSDSRDGLLLSLADETQWATNMAGDSLLKNIITQRGQPIESGLGLGSLDVLGTEFYQPPAEFVPQGETNINFYRQVHVGVALQYAGSLPGATPLYAGTKPGALMLTRPPVVFVHGINSDPFDGSLSPLAWRADNPLGPDNREVK